MVQWTLRLVVVVGFSTTILLGIAQILTTRRLAIRYRSRRLWWDDAWALLAMMCSFMLLTAMWIRTDVPGVGPLHQPHSVRLVAYWLVSLSFTNVLWSTFFHCMIFESSVINASQMTLRKITNNFAVLFSLMWLGLIIQKVYICASDTHWYALAVPQCHLGYGVAIFELATDIVADLVLAVIPIRLVRDVHISKDQRKMLFVIFSASLLTTMVSIIHAVYLLGPTGLLEAITAQAEAATALIVADMGVIVTTIYRFIRRGGDFDSDPYTFQVSVATNGSIHLRKFRVDPAQQSTASTMLQFVQDRMAYARDTNTGIDWQVELPPIKSGPFVYDDEELGLEARQGPNKSQPKFDAGSLSEI